MTTDRLDRPLRIVQTNLQVRDTDAIDPGKLARQIDDLGGNTLVFNVGGIYAWYDTDVPHHAENPHLPGGDLLGDVVEACHERDVALVGRVDFSKANDEVYAHHPEWFARDPDGESRTVGAERPGGWPLLRPTCPTSGYRREAVAEPVLEELLARYDLDAVFYNAPGYVRCHCDTCRREYEERYGEPLPDDPGEFEDDWAERCVGENARRRYEVIEGTDPDVRTILYYGSNGSNLAERAAATDLLCTESQNVLSRGHGDLPGAWKPARTMKIADTLEDGPPPVGIIHACPGMDWRHLGIPPAEYAAWVSQVPANGGHVWHTLTGVPDTIADDRIFDVVRDLNERVELIEPHMADAESAARTVLLWDDTDASRGLLDGLTRRQVPFDLLLPDQATAERLGGYDLAVVPAGWERTPSFVDELCAYADDGGRLLVEGDLPEDAGELFDRLGVAGNTHTGEELVASYSRFEGEDNPLQRGLGGTDLLPHRGRVHYSEPTDEATTLTTLVPQWSPLEAVGAPPERASLPVEHTDVPTAIGNDGTLYLPFALGDLISEYRIEDHYRLLENAAAHLLGERLVDVTAQQGLQLTPFAVEGGYLLHFVNATGERPLSTTTPLPELDVELAVGSEVTEVRSLFAGESLDYEQSGAGVAFTVPPVEVWDAVLVRRSA